MDHQELLDLSAETSFLLCQIADGELSVPEPEGSWKDKLDELTKASLIKHRAAAIHDMRVEQAKNFGFKRVSGIKNLIGAMMDTSSDEISSGEESERKNYDYVYFHHEDEIDFTEGGGTWGMEGPTYYYNEVKTGKWFLPPFKTKKIWTVRMLTRLDLLEKPIPHTVVAGINALKAAKFFNIFRAYESEEDHRTIIIASLWELPPKEDGSPGTRANRTDAFFITFIP